MLKGNEQFLDIQTPGIKGWNTYDPADSVDDQEIVDVTNMVYDGGFIAPRPGTSLFAEKPDGEAGTPLQTIVARTSDGLQYLIALYANHFYLYHPDNSEWIRINNGYVQAETDLVYGYVNWNNGRGDDRLYVCNGVDNQARWDVCVSTVAGAHNSGVGAITLTDGTRFPNSGTLVLMGSGGVFTEAYSSRSGNVFTLTGTLSDNVADGASATLDMVEKSGMELGKVLSKYGSRLQVMNYYGGETTKYYSKLNDPEDFTTGTGIDDASSAVIADGNGEITGSHDFGSFEIIEKEDSFHSFNIQVSQDLASKLDEIHPIFSGASMGPINMQSTIKMQNKLFYPTKTEGFYSATPAVSGGNVSITPDLVSQNIQSYVLNSISLDNCKGVLYRQKAFWAVSRRNSTQNTIVLMYDTVRNAWSKHENWSVQDWAVLNGNMYYMEHGSGRIFQCFTRTYNDDNNPYHAGFYTKRFNMGKMSQVKTCDLLYVQGLITPQTTIYVDVYKNEGGELNTQTYAISMTTGGVLVSNKLTDAQGDFMLGAVAMGYIRTLGIGDIHFFRTYLGLKIGDGLYNMQARVYANTVNFWGITGIGFAPELSPVIPANMVLSPQ